MSRMVLVGAYVNPDRCLLFRHSEGNEPLILLAAVLPARHGMAIVMAILPAWQVLSGVD